MICELNDAVARIERHLLDNDPLAVAQRCLTMPVAHFHASSCALGHRDPPNTCADDDSPSPPPSSPEAQR